MSSRSMYFDGLQKKKKNNSPTFVDSLTEDETWTLFQNHANVEKGDKEVVARQIAKECKGLPITIDALGMC